MSKHFKKGPDHVPESLLKPTSKFKQKVVLATAGILGFVLVYFSLMIYFGYQGVQLLRMVAKGGSPAFFLILTGVCFLIISLFMVKSILFFNKREAHGFKELTKDEEPELVEFIELVAQETGAPKPNKIFLSDRVNASVFYHLSFINILFPTKKNLEIGLGLTNILNITEFKAILAHEFGHFAQKSMLLGRYVYVGQQIAVRIIHKRDALDQGLAFLSSIDLRIAWIGWILSIIVWAIRAFIEVIFSVVVISERALSREMEFQADNVAVSVTGSDALVFALHKLTAADQGFRSAIDIADKLLRHQKEVPNIYALQSHYIEQMKKVLDDPNFGTIPYDAELNASYRLFKNGLVNPPEMWATHPADIDREINAKSPYIAYPIDPTNAMELFAHPKELYVEVTTKLFSKVEVERTLVSVEESIEFMDKELFNWEFLNSRYKGCYLNRFPFSYFTNVDEIFEIPFDGIASSYAQIYPESIKEKLDLHKELVEEIGLLSHAKNDLNAGKNGKLVHRGKEIKRRDLPKLLENLRTEEAKVNAELVAHDQLIRKTNLEAARSFGISHLSYYKSIVSLLHFAEHSINELNAQNLQFQHTLFSVTADGKVTEEELYRLQRSADKLWNALSTISDKSTKIPFSQELNAKLGNTDGSTLFEPFIFDAPTNHNMQSWVDNYGGWLHTIMLSLGKMRNVLLEHLLTLESQLEAGYKQGIQPAISTAIPTPEDYARKLNATEDDNTVSLTFWDKFIAGIGLFPKTAKFTAAGGIILAALFAGTFHPGGELYINNSFGSQIIVDVNGKTYTIDPHSYYEIEINGDVDIQAKTPNGELIDEFSRDTDGMGKYVYNIGNGAYLTSYTMYYGGIKLPAESIIGPVLWTEAYHDFILQDAPDQIYTSNSSTSRSAIVTYDQLSPLNFPELDITQETMINSVINHLILDPPGDQYINDWLRLAATLENGETLIRERISRFKDDISSYRTLQDLLKGAKKEALQKEIQSKFNQTNQGDLLYLLLRGKSDDPAINSAFYEAYTKYPSSKWLAYGAAWAYASEGKWLQSIDAYSEAYLDKQIESINVSTMFRVDRYCTEILGESTRFKSWLYPETAYLVAIEDGEEAKLGMGDMFFHYLNSGDLSQAERELNGIPTEYQDFYGWYLVTSKGSSVQLELKFREKDLATSTNFYNAPCAVGFYMDQGLDYKKPLNYLIQYNFTEDEPAKIANTRNFFENVKNNNFKAAEENLVVLNNFVTAAQLKMAASIYLKERTPKSWSDEIKTILLVNERPFVGW